MEETPELFPGDNFVVEDFFDFSNEDEDDQNVEDAYVAVSDAVTDDSAAGENANPPSFSGDQGCFVDNMNFPEDLCVPCDDIAELEWLSNIVDEESFSNEDIHNLQLISGFNTRPVFESEFQLPDPYPNRIRTLFAADFVTVPAKSRTRRPRTPSCVWPSRGLFSDDPLSPGSSEPGTGHQNHALPPPPPPPVRLPKKNGNGGGGGSRKKKPASSVAGESGSGSGGGDVRRCQHCLTDKTPQWRTGPAGPKTLCNACGVRYKSGRLVPEYRPAASPTFMLTKHSNSHRKVMELRRQKEMMRAQQEFFSLRDHRTDGVVFESDVSSDGEDFLIHQHIGSDFRQLI